MKNKTFPIIDLHTDFILGEANLAKKIFDIDTSKQISQNLVDKSEVKLLFAGFSYDNEKNCTKIMLSEMEKFVERKRPKFKIIFHLEGAQILAKNPKLLGTFLKRGVGSIGLAHTHDNSLCGSSSESNSGLTPLGRKIIKHALKLGMIIDLAHMSVKALDQTLKLVGKKPPILSHTACFSIENNPRNTKDSELKKISKMNGIVGIFFSGKYINPKKQPTINDVIDHIEHAVSVAGIEHVGIGSDFGGITTGVPLGLESAAKLPNLLSELSDRGYSKSDLEAISFRNAQRVLSAWGLEV